MTDAEVLAGRVCDRLIASGQLSPAWAAAVPRHRFIPDCARLWFIDPLTGSWANLVHRPDTSTYPVHQSGPRNLWDEIENAYHWWCDAGRPGSQRWRITVTAAGQQVTLTTR
ncbi:MAG: hypothetical protein JO115_17810 [Pseudonocardiales bacterium]|nr:hypothetical protein [Pseudonocardiales bacterium]